MEEKEFVLEALKRLTPDTSWHGVCEDDEETYKNIPILAEMAYFIMSELFHHSVVPDGNADRDDFKAIAKMKREIIEEIGCSYFGLDPDYFN